MKTVGSPRLRRGLAAGRLFSVVGHGPCERWWLIRLNPVDVMTTGFVFVKRWLRSSYVWL